MGLIVQKYGGSSVADAKRIKAVGDRIKRTVDAGNQVVVVVSAMGKTTDALIKLATEVSDHPSERELDLLLATGEQVSVAVLGMALQGIGQPAIALTGFQVKIVTETHHTRARILHVETENIQSCLNQGKVVIVTGFQGVAFQMESSFPEVTTLGRGGSDTSAVAIAAALNADLCEIYTDVPGILTTDPRLVPNAKLLSAVTCDEMLELASLGAKVLHPRAVEIARNFGVKLAVRSSWIDDPGTLVLSSPLTAKGDVMKLEVNRFVDAVSVDRNQAKMAILEVPDRPGIAAALFKALAEAGVNVDLIIQSIQVGDVNDIAFTVPKAELEHAKAIVSKLGLGASEVISDLHVAKVSIIGAGIVGRPGVAAQAFSALGKAGINIQMISTSEIKLSCMISENDVEVAIASLCQTFNVDPIELAVTETLPVSPTLSPVCGVALDLNQARLAIRDVPDRPGIAAKLFQDLADCGISVDMIIQSQSDRDRNDIAFTVPIAYVQTAELVLKQVAANFGCGDVASDEAIAKISIVGTGMIEQTGVAAQMFSALAKASINIEMIATSEIKVSCVVRQTQAATALKIVHEAFGLGGEQTIQVPGQLPGQA